MLLSKFLLCLHCRDLSQPNYGNCPASIVSGSEKIHRYQSQVERGVVVVRNQVIENRSQLHNKKRMDN